MSDYKNALLAAGAEVIAFEEFGTYHGDWFAKVRYNGIVAWVHGEYGSSAGCDDFLSSVGSCSHLHGERRHYPYDDGFHEGCETCAQAKQRLVVFGEHYLNDLLTQEQVESCIAGSEWDLDSAGVLKFLTDNAIIDGEKSTT